MSLPGDSAESASSARMASTDRCHSAKRCVLIRRTCSQLGASISARRTRASTPSGDRRRRTSRGLAQNHSASRGRRKRSRLGSLGMLETQSRQRHQERAQGRGDVADGNVFQSECMDRGTGVIVATPPRPAPRTRIRAAPTVRGAQVPARRLGRREGESRGLRWNMRGEVMRARPQSRFACRSKPCRSVSFPCLRRSDRHPSKCRPSRYRCARPSGFPSSFNGFRP
ncbi:hypothetical protein C8N44_12718 [Allosediminivita pacifica]|uniref:Uncharacterized protein n=1 Tax=Allosediminivita pacifica TaxID=1267769 RepID=A0A2T6ADA7_9RHOB|nr:hypothetical protein C8N44_12718 [Allosediminivita pacifica]